VTRSTNRSTPEVLAPCAPVALDGNVATFILRWNFSVSQRGAQACLGMLLQLSLRQSSRAHLRRASLTAQAMIAGTGASSCEGMSGQGDPPKAARVQPGGLAVAGRQLFAASFGRKPYGAASCRARHPR